MYKDKQDFRTAANALKKEKENDNLNHELRHNVILVYFSFTETWL